MAAVGDPPKFKPDKSLEDRFIEFVRKFPGSELIDELDIDTSKADFFFEQRSIICELKSLKTDTAPKINTVLAPYKDSEHWPRFYGPWPLSKVLSHLPNSEALNQKIGESVTSSVSELVRKANRQIRATKEQFDLGESEGILVILNDMVDVISPEVLGHRVVQLLKKVHEDGRPQFPHIQCVLTINETHYIDLHQGLCGIPGLTIVDEHNPSLVNDFAARLHAKWADFMGMPLVNVQADHLKLESCKSWQAFEKSQGPETNSDRWRRIYRESPYLAKLSTEELLDWGRHLMAGLEMAHSPKNNLLSPQVRLAQLFPPSCHFLEEINRRGIDMRRLKQPDDWEHPYIDRLHRKCTGQIQVGTYYTIPETGANFVCWMIDGEKAMFELVEAYDTNSFKPLMGIFTFYSEHTKRMLEVACKGEIHRLKKIRKLRQKWQ